MFLNLLIVAIVMAIAVESVIVYRRSKKKRLADRSALEIRAKLLGLVPISQESNLVLEYRCSLTEERNIRQRSQDEKYAFWAESLNRKLNKNR